MSRFQTMDHVSLATVELSSNTLFQCPLGLELLLSLLPNTLLLSVSMPSRAYTSFLHLKQISEKLLSLMFQCPLGLIPHFYGEAKIEYNGNIFGFNALSGLYLISTVPLQKPRFYAVSRACFCRYLSEYSDNSRFSCMLTFGTYLMRCTYP